MKVKPMKLLSLLLATSLIFLTGCGGKESDPATTPSSEGEAGSTEMAPESEGTGKQSQELTIYSCMPEPELPYYFNAFTEDTGIKVNYIRLSQGEVLTRMRAEAAHPNASIFHGGPSDGFIAAAQEGLLEPYESPEMVNIMDDFKDPDNNWTPFYIGVLSFTCNSDWFEKNNVEYPKTWEDLLKPEFKDQISMAHPSTSGTSYTILATIMQLMGEEKAWDYLTELDKNIRQYTKVGSAPPMEVALGEAAIAITFAHDGLKPAHEGYPIKVILPEDGTGVEVGALALIKNGPEEEAENARLFIDWTLSVRGQETLIEAKSNRLPTNGNAKVTDGLTPLAEVNTIDYDAVWAGENRDRLIAEFDEKISNAENLK